MDDKVMISKDDNGHEQVNEELIDVSDYMFTKNGEDTEINFTTKEHCNELFQRTIYSPFFNKTDTKNTPVSNIDNSLMSRIYPFADNRPICKCDMVKQMTANPDVRYLLSLLPDMAEMNTEQKSVFKTRVLTLLHKTLMVES